MSERLPADRLRRVTPLAVTAVVLTALPLLAPTPYDLRVFTAFCINVLILVGLNLLSGYGGQISMGHAAFYGAGAYTITVGSVKAGLDPLLCFFLAPLVAGVFALLVGLPSLRLRGLYFAMATLGVAVIFETFLDRATGITGGPNGIGISPIVVGPLDLGQPLTLYIVTAVIAWLGVLGAELFLRTRVGWGLRAAHASEPAAAVVGINIAGVRLVTVLVSGAYAGLAGGLEAFNSLYVSPTTFGFLTSVMLFVVLTIGGMGSWLGPLFGAGLFLVFDRWLPEFTEEEPLILAAIFVVALRLFPGGIAYGVERGVRRAIDFLRDGGTTETAKEGSRG